MTKAEPDKLENPIAKTILEPELGDLEIICEVCSKKVNVWTHLANCPHLSEREWLEVEAKPIDEFNKK